MYDHVGLTVRDLAASLRFYEAALAPLGHALGPRDETSAGLGPPGEPGFWLYVGDGDGGGASGGAGGRGAHVAFRAATRSAVDRFHESGLGAGGRDNGAAGPRPDYGPHYYAAFLLDPDGNNVEAVCLAEAG
jgi:catechol 2,3-dioxygenase-like lactoylglutathione lyase family enzyme